MMNRRERRAAKKRNPHPVLFIDHGYLLEGDPNYGTDVVCSVCAAPHKALGFARIQDKSGPIYLPLCEPCVASPDVANTLARKIWNAPDLEIDEGGEATTEQVLAVAEKQDVTEH